MVKYVVGGNWKMQVPTIEEAVSIAKSIAEKLPDNKEIDTFIAPSSYALYEVGKAIIGTNLKLAGQNICAHDKGAFTGMTSVLSLVEAGCEYVILGHSERRRLFGEKNNWINHKVHLALEHGLKVVLCIGETAKERAEGKMKEININQLETSLKDIAAEQMKNIVIAYEPVWAINNKYLNPGIEIKAATVGEAVESHKVVRNWLQRKYGEEIAKNTVIQYGGSMKPANADTLLSENEINGGLIGGASLKAETFIPIIEAAIKNL